MTKEIYVIKRSISPRSED